MTARGGRAELPSPSRPLVAGVDVGGTKVAAIVVDGDDAVLGRAVLPMRGTSPATDTAPIVAAVRAALDAAGVPVEALGAIGVGVPGRVDPDTGIVGLATNLGWRDVPLARLVEDEFGVPSRVENDVRLAAAGLAGHDLAGGAGTLAYLAIGTGIGAGIVLDGRVYRGGRGMAGEIGHIVVEGDGVACRCGQRGCLETVASGPSIARRAAEAVAGGAQTALRAVDPITAKAVYDAARDGDTVALGVVDAAGVHLARAVAALVLTCDLECVLIGGGVAEAGDAFLRPVRAELDRLRSGSPLIAELVPPGAVRLLPTQFDAVARGGVGLARRTAREAEASRAIDGTGIRIAPLEEVAAREPQQ
jgi:glucokinase